jgi:hypothetical protein
MRTRTTYFDARCGLRCSSLRRILPRSAAYLAGLANGREIAWIVTRSRIPVPAGIITPLHAVGLAPHSLSLCFLFIFVLFVVVFCFIISAPMPPSVSTLGDAVRSPHSSYLPCPLGDEVDKASDALCPR